MKDLKDMSTTELTAVIGFTEALAARASFASGDVWGHLSDPDEEDITSTRKAAEEYARSRNANSRTRHYNDADENAREGVKSALDWLRRKQKSAIRKG